MISPKTIIGKNLFCPELGLVNVYCKSIGDDCRIGAFVEIGKNVVIGDRVSIGAFCFIPEGWQIGNDVFIGPQVLFLNDKYPPSKGAWREAGINIVEDGAVIGGGSIILPGAHIREKAFIGAGSLVTKEIAANSRVYGSPARTRDIYENFRDNWKR